MRRLRREAFRWWRVVGLAGGLAQQLREHQRFFGPASFGQPDDIEIFVCAQTGSNRAALEGLLGFLVQQRFRPTAPPVEALFAPLVTSNE